MVNYVDILICKTFCIHWIHLSHDVFLKYIYRYFSHNWFKIFYSTFMHKIIWWLFPIFIFSERVCIKRELYVLRNFSRTSPVSPLIAELLILLFKSYVLLREYRCVLLQLTFPLKDISTVLQILSFFYYIHLFLKKPHILSFLIVYYYPHYLILLTIAVIEYMKLCIYKRNKFIWLMVVETGQSKSMAVASGEGLNITSEHGREEEEKAGRCERDTNEVINPVLREWELTPTGTNSIS